MKIFQPTTGGTPGGGPVTSISQGVGITLSPNPIIATGSVTSNLSTGIAGGQSVIGGTAAAQNLRLSSTANATKGRILFGDSFFDEAINQLAIITTNTSPFYITDSGFSSPLILTSNDGTGTTGMFINGTKLATGNGSVFTYADGGLLVAYGGGIGAVTIANLATGGAAQLVTADTSGTLSITPVPSGGLIGGTIADTQVAFGTASNTIGGDAGLIYKAGNLGVGAGATPLANLQIGGAGGIWVEGASPTANFGLGYNVYWDAGTSQWKRLAAINDVAFWEFQTPGAQSIGFYVNSDGGNTVGSVITPVQVASFGITGATVATRLTVGSSTQGTGRVNILGTGTSLNITGSTLLGNGTESWIKLAGTLPAVTTQPVAGMTYAVTSAGSSSQTQTAESVTLAAGYTGSSTTRGSLVQNFAKGTGTFSDLSTVVANFGQQINMFPLSGTSTGYNVGSIANAESGTNNVGFLGRTVSTSGVSTNVGLWGGAVAAGGASAGVYGTISTTATQSFPSVTAAGAFTSFDSGLNALAITTQIGNALIIDGVSGATFNSDLFVVNNGSTSPLLNINGTNHTLNFTDASGSIFFVDGSVATNPIISLGDFSVSGNGGYIKIDNTSSAVTTIASTLVNLGDASNTWQTVDSLNHVITLGDTQNNFNSTKFLLEDGTPLIQARIDGIFKITDTAGAYDIFNADLNNRIIVVGDNLGVGNSTRVKVDDVAEEIHLSRTVYLDDSPNTDPTVVLTTHGSGDIAFANVAAVVGSGNASGATAAVANVAAYAPPTLATFEVGGYISVTAISAGTLNLQVTFNDENNTARTLTFFPQGLTSGNLTATGFYAMPPMTIRATTGTNIVIKTTFAGVSVTYDVGGIIKQL